jgi:hypothetical protein
MWNPLKKEEIQLEALETAIDGEKGHIFKLSQHVYKARKAGKNLLAEIRAHKPCTDKPFTDRFSLPVEVGSTYGQVWLATLPNDRKQKQSAKQFHITNERQRITLSIFRELFIMSKVNDPHIIHTSLKDIILDPEIHILSFAYDYGAVDVLLVEEKPLNAAGHREVDLVRTAARAQPPPEAVDCALRHHAVEFAPDVADGAGFPGRREVD